MAAAQPWHSLASPFGFILFFFFPSSPPLRFFLSLSFAFKWSSLASWGRLGGQGEPQQGAHRVRRRIGRNFGALPVGRAAQALGCWDPAQGKSSCRPPGADSPTLSLQMGHVRLELVQSLRTLSQSSRSGKGFAPIQGLGSPKCPTKLWGNGVWWEAAEFCAMSREKPCHQLSSGLAQLGRAKGMLRLWDRKGGPHCSRNRAQVISAPPWIKGLPWICRLVAVGGWSRHGEQAARHALQDIL